MEMENESLEFSHSKRVRLAIADDYPLVLLAVEKLAGRFPNVEVVCRSVNSTRLEESLARGGGDVTLPSSTCTCPAGTMAMASN